MMDMGNTRFKSKVISELELGEKGLSREILSLYTENPKRTK